MGEVGVLAAVVEEVAGLCAGDGELEVEHPAELVGGLSAGGGFVWGVVDFDEDCVGAAVAGGEEAEVAGVEVHADAEVDLGEALEAHEIGAFHAGLHAGIDADDEFALAAEEFVGREVFDVASVEISIEKILMIIFVYFLLVANRRRAARNSSGHSKSFRSWISDVSFQRAYSASFL